MGLFLSEVHKDIKKALDERNDKKAKRDAKSIYARSTWTRMWSTSDKETIIAGGLLKGKETRGGFSDIYSPKSKTGNSFKPLPGITSVHTKYQGDLGTTRSCAIEWICWTFEDVDKLQPLFMTHGKTVVIEWGWSTGDKKQTIGLDPSKICNIYKDSKFVRKKVLKSGGNFDAMIGLVTGWDWHVQNDGSIKCTTNLIAHGTNALDSSIRPLEAQKDGDKEQLLGYVENIYTRLKDLGDEWSGDDGAASKYVSDDEAYVNWAFIEDEIITKHIAMESDGGVKMPVMKSVSYDVDGKESGPTLIFRPPKLENIKGDVLRVKASSPFKSFKAKKNNGAPLRNLVLNVKTVKDCFENVDTLQDAITALFKRMNDAACEIWDFRIVTHEEKPGQFGVVDANWGENRVKEMKKKAYIFPTWNGNNSIVRDQDLSADLPDAMAMSVMYGTNKPKTSTAETDDPQAQKAAEALSSGGPEDDCLKNPEGRKGAKEVKTTENSGKGASGTNPEKNLQEGTKGDRGEEESTDEKVTEEEAKKICAGVNKNKIKQIDMLYPINLALTLDGISGFQWGNAIHTEFIPKVYKDKVVFQVTAVDHKIDDGDWETSIETACRVATD